MWDLVLHEGFQKQPTDLSELEARMGWPQSDDSHAE